MSSMRIGIMPMLFTVSREPVSVNLVMLEQQTNHPKEPPARFCVTCVVGLLHTSMDWGEGAEVEEADQRSFLPRS